MNDTTTNAAARARAWLGWALCLAALGCGDDASGADAATTDAAMSADAGADAATTDAAMSADAATTDAAMSADAAVSDAGVDDAGPACADGTYDDDADPSTPCVPWTDCPPGEYVAAPGTDTSDRACAPCPAGTYSDAVNAAACTDCPAVDHCASGLSCTSADDATCDECEDGFVPEDGGALCVEPWAWQFGTGADDRGLALAADPSGNLYVAGRTAGALEGANAGHDDAFVRKVAPDGSTLWTRQFGTVAGDSADAVAVDADGNVYVAGLTGGALEGSPLGILDAFVRKYGPDGTALWTRQFGTSSIDSASGVAVDADGNVYVVGETRGALEGANLGGNDAFVRKLDPAGTALWTHQFGTASDESANDVVVDATGAVYVVGETQGALEGANAGAQDTVVRKLDADGAVLWTRQFGTSYADLAYAVTLDASGDVYVAGETWGALDGSSAGLGDIFVRKVTPDGTAVWTRQTGTSSDDEGRAVAADASGVIYVAGHTRGALEGTRAGSWDAVVVAYDTAGALLWTDQRGTDQSDFIDGVVADGYGGAHVAGATGGAWPGQTSAGGMDIFFAHFGH